MSFVFISIAHIQLAAPKGSEDEAKRFFGDILGFREIEKPELLRKRGGVWFEFANYQIHIGIEEPFTPAKKAHPAFEIVNIEGLKSHLSKNDIKFIIDEDLPGANRIYINDPFGNRIEVLEWV
ncbi:VOC family protein [Viridibacillus arvi]|uniref:VOC family protein n=1 Tax=Viridibacillus arvi TaxID=263475 RepID=UPI003D071DE0